MAGVGAVGIAVFAVVSGSSGISVAKKSMQNDQRITLGSCAKKNKRKKRKKKSGRKREGPTRARNTYP